MKTASLLILALIIGSCNTTKNTTKDISMNKTPDTKSDGDKVIISAPIVAKEFINKGGKASGFNEYYIQRSVQDYFIKFCEGSVTRKELESHLDTNEFAINSLTMEVEFTEGDWDICDGDPEHMQSRIGEYAIIHRIIK